MTAAATTTGLTPQQQKEARAQKERERRIIAKAIERAALPMKPGELDAEQRARALAHNGGDGEKGNLTGKPLAEWILHGKGLREQTKDAQAIAAAAKKEGRGRQNATRSSDPDAATLALDAKALAPDVKSAFLPKDARAFIDEILKGQPVEALLTRTVTEEVKADGETGEKGATVTQTREVKVTWKAVEAFGRKGEKDKDVRAHLAALGHGTRLWGRKLALMMLAQRAIEKKAPAAE